MTMSSIYLISTTRATPWAMILAYVKLRRSFKQYFAISAFLLLQVFLLTAMIFLSLYSYISIRKFSYISSTILQKTNILRWPPLLHSRIILFSPARPLSQPVQPLQLLPFFFQVPAFWRPLSFMFLQVVLRLSRNLQYKELRPETQCLRFQCESVTH